MSAPNDNTLRNRFDKANPNEICDLFRKIGLGSVLQGQLPQVRRNVNMNTAAVDPYQLATVQTLKLPDTGKAVSIVRAYCRTTGSAGTGALTVAAYGATPTTGQIAVAPNGDIVTVATDQMTNIDVTYLPERCDVVELTLPVVSHILTIPTNFVTQGVVLLTEVESMVGTLTGKLKILVPSTAPATGYANLSVAKNTVLFATADAVTSARVKLAIVTSNPLATALEGLTL